MKKIVFALFIIFLSFASGNVWAQIDSVYWNFGTASGTNQPASSSNALVPVSSCWADTGNVNGTGSLSGLGPNISSASSGYTGASGSYNLANRNNGDASFSTATNCFYTFTITPPAGRTMNVSGISFGMRSTATGITQYAISSNVGGYGTAAATGSISNNSVWVLGTYTLNITSTTPGAPIIVRIYGYAGNSGSTSAANWRIDDVTIRYSLVSLASITTNALSASAFCPGNTVSVPFTATGTYNSGNVFTAQLSDASGSFATPVAIGTLTATASGTISATIPGATAAGTGYRIRVVSSNPVVTGTDNGSDITINAQVTPSVTITANPGNSICSGTPVTFTATPVNGGTTPGYVWKKGTSVVGGNTATYTDNGLINGDVITVVMTSNANCASPASATSNGITMNVTAQVTPSVSITANPGNSICSGTPVTFTASPVNGGTTPDYVWMKGSSAVGSNTATYTDNTLANGDVITVTMTSHANCASPASVTSTGITMTVNATVVPSVTIAAQPGDSVCAGVPVTFTATPVNGGGAPDYEWRKGTAVVGSNSPVYTDNTLADGDIVTVLMTSNASCAAAGAVSSNAVTMTIVPLPVITVTPASPVTFCQNQPIQLTATGGGSYQWLYAQNVLTDSTAATLTPVTSGTYHVLVTMEGCSDTSADVEVVIKQLPVLIITANGNILTVANTYSNYQWYLNGQPVPGANTYTYTATQGGSYTVSAENADGCSDTSAAHIVTGVFDLSATMVHIYPNPVTETLLIAGTESFNVTVLSADGSVCLQEMQVRRIYMGNLADGIYLVKLTDRNGVVVKTERVQKMSR